MRGRRLDKKMSVLLSLMLAALLLLGGCVSEEAAEELVLLYYEDDGTELAIEEPAPDFKLTSLDGETVSLEQYKGQIVLLTFFTTT